MSRQITLVMTNVPLFLQKNLVVQMNLTLLQENIVDRNRDGHCQRYKMNFIFQQDGTPPHYATVFQSFSNLFCWP